MAYLKWSFSAVKDMEGIVDFIASDSEKHASFFAKEVFATIENIALFPLSGRIVPELQNENIREKIYKNYRIIYRTKGDAIEIIRIIHDARKFMIQE